MDQTGLEQSLIAAEEKAGKLLKLLTTAGTALRKIQNSAGTGNLRQIRKSIDDVNRIVRELQDGLEDGAGIWNFDEESYLSGSGFIRELLQYAHDAALNLVEQDGRLYCYPFIIRILSAERALLIDRKRTTTLRPSKLVQELKREQTKPPRFSPASFIESLLAGYTFCARASTPVALGQVFPLTHVYRLFTILPGQSRDYSLQDFARDIYLLDRSGIQKTKDGMLMRLSASTALRSSAERLSTVTEQGSLKDYFGISFSPEGST